MSFYLKLGKAFLLGQGPPVLRRKVLPIKLTVASTYHCNHRCKLCSVWAIYQRSPERARDELSPDDYASVFSQLKDTLLYLDWTGGEPFMRPDISEILVRAREICGKLSSIVITTNGLLTRKTVQAVTEVAGRVGDCAVSIGVSLDGDEERHDDMRGKQGAYTAAISTIKELKKAAERFPNLEVKVSYTLSSVNAGLFGYFYENVARPLGLSFGEVTFNFEHAGNLYQSSESPAKPKEEAAVEDARKQLLSDVKYILEHLSKEKMPAAQKARSFYRRHFIEGIPRFMATPDRVLFPCKAAQNSLFLDPYGNVYPCIIWDKCLGTFRDGIREIAAFDQIAEIREAIRKHSCPVCWNACELIPSLLTSWSLPGCVWRSLRPGRP